MTEDQMVRGTLCQDCPWREGVFPPPKDVKTARNVCCGPYGSATVKPVRKKVNPGSFCPDRRIYDSLSQAAA